MGTYQIRAEEAIQRGNFFGITIRADHRTQSVINSRQFYQSLIDSMLSRMVSEEEEDFFEKVSILDPSSLASLSKEKSPTFGEEDLRWLCDFFRIEFSAVKTEYREFKDDHIIIRSENLEYLKHCTDTIAVSSAECERGFSEMNDICSSLRSRLTVKHISNLMFIALVGPPLRDWNPDRYVDKWLITRRSADHEACMKRCKVTKPHEYSESVWKILV
jgi:hypothetical protein